MGHQICSVQHRAKETRFETRVSLWSAYSYQGAENINFKSKAELQIWTREQDAANNRGSAWSSMKTIAGLWNPKNSSHVTLDGFSSDTEFANALNRFYICFDARSDFCNEIQELSHKLEDNQHFDIKGCWKGLHFGRANKSHGPDSICCCLLKSCAKERNPVFHHIFSKSLRHSST